MREDKKKLSFGGGLLIYITVMITLIFVALAVWWHYLSCYEAARCEGVMDRYMSETLQQELEQEIYDYASEYATGYQTQSEIAGVLSAALDSDAWHYVLKGGVDDPVYTLYCGDLPVGEAVMQAGQADALSMGLAQWQTPDAVFDFGQFGRTITVTVPYGCEVYLNGHVISEDLVRETIGLYPQLQAFESLITEPNQLLVYEIANVFSDVAVEYSGGYTMLKGGDVDVYYALPTCDDFMGEELTEYCKAYVRAYVEYTANATALWALQQYLVTDSALYEELTAASSGLNWGHGVNAVVETVEIKNFAYYGNVITCDASYITTRDDGDRSEVMQLLLVNTNIGWRVIHMNII